MDLGTRYLGLDLPHPFMPGASPLVSQIDTVRQLEDAGAAAIVMYSLFEEQIALKRPQILRHVDRDSNRDPHIISYFPKAEDFAHNTEEYLQHIQRIKQAVDIPVIASLNGATPAWWLEYARFIEQAGADALELNIYFLATDPLETSDAVDRRLVETSRDVKASVSIPVAVKLSPYFSCLAHLAHQLDLAGIDGLILFNRFYQPEIDPDALEVTPTVHLSDPSELLLRLRWLAILSGTLKAGLAVTGGVHSGLDAARAVLAGADAVQMVSSLFRNGPGHLKTVRREFTSWMERNGHSSIDDVRGLLSYRKHSDPGAFERANYVRVLQSRKS